MVDFDVKAELERIQSYKPLYNKTLFNKVKFKNKRIYWSDHFDQIFATAHVTGEGEGALCKPLNYKPQ